MLLDACHLQMQASKQERERALCKLSKPLPHKLRIAKLCAKQDKPNGTLIKAQTFRHVSFADTGKQAGAGALQAY